MEATLNDTKNRYSMKLSGYQHQVCNKTDKSFTHPHVIPHLYDSFLCGKQVDIIQYILKM